MKIVKQNEFAARVKVIIDGLLDHEITRDDAVKCLSEIVIVPTSRTRRLLNRAVAPMTAGGTVEKNENGDRKCLVDINRVEIYLSLASEGVLGSFDDETLDMWHACVNDTPKEHRPFVGSRFFEQLLEVSDELSPEELAGFEPADDLIKKM